jgi:hypothetical protein
MAARIRFVVTDALSFLMTCRVAVTGYIFWGI